jgi:hypothetical protein
MLDMISSDTTAMSKGANTVVGEKCQGETGRQQQRWVINGTPIVLLRERKEL